MVQLLSQDPVMYVILPLTVQMKMVKMLPVTLKERLNIMITIQKNQPKQIKKVLSFKRFILFLFFGFRYNISSIAT